MGIFYKYTKPLGEVSDFLPRDGINHPTYGKWQRGTRLLENAEIVDVRPVSNGKLTSGYTYRHQTFHVLFEDDFLFVVDKKCGFDWVGLGRIQKNWDEGTIDEVIEEAYSEHDVALRIQAEEDAAAAANAASTSDNNIDANYSEADEIAKYKQLFDNGAITKEEYEAKKKQLLGL